MGFLDSLKSIFSGGDSYEQSGHWIYVRCNRCGEAIKTRLDLRRDLNPRDEGGYISRKTLVGNQLCFERIEVTLMFDDRRNVTEQQIEKGQFITAEAYEAASAEQ